MNSLLKVACLLAVFASCLYKSEAFVIPRNETEGGPCRNFTINNILEILEELRSRMHLPIPRFNVPPLNPLFIEHISLQNFELLAGLDIQLHDITMVGINRFEARDLDFNLLGFELSLNFFIPELVISGHHVSNGTLYGLVPVIGSGPMRLTVSNLSFPITGDLHHNDTTNLWSVENLSVNFTISGLSGAFENLSDNFFNDLLNLSGPEILELAWPGLQPGVQDVIGWAAAEFLNSYTIEELMGLLFGAGIDWSDVDDQTTSAPPAAAPTAVPSY